MAAQVLKADCSAVDTSFVRKNLAGQTDVWLTYTVAFDAAALAFWTGAGYSGDFGDIEGTDTLFAFTHNLESVYVYDAGFFSEDADPFNDGAGPAPIDSTWQLVEEHWKSGDVHEVYVDGTLQWTEAAYVGSVDSILVGDAYSSGADADNIAYIGYVKVGSTRGATDIFFDDFSSGTLAGYDHTEGDVSVVDDPFGGDVDGLGEDDALKVRVGGTRPNYISKDFTTPPGLSNVYVEAEVLFDDLALRTWEAQSGGFLELQGAEVLCRVYLVKQGVRWVWAAYSHGTGKDVWAVGTEEVVAGSHTISVHFDSSTVAVVADTDSVVIPTSGRAYAVAVGQTFLADNSGAVAYIASVKVGTTAGGDDLLSEDFDAITITGSLYGSDENTSAEASTLAAVVAVSQAGASSENGVKTP